MKSLVFQGSRIPRRNTMTTTPRHLKIATSAALVAVFLAAAPAIEAGINLISLQQEWQMRDQLHSQVTAEHRVHEDAYLSSLGRRLVAQTELGNLPWNFFVVQDSAANAFNLPGGLVYVNSGLIAEAESLDQLAGVLAHEIAHGTERHGTQLMTRSYGYGLLANLLLGRDPGMAKQLIAQVVGTGILTDYSRDAERAADRLGVATMYRAGYDPGGMSDFFRKLLDVHRRRPSKVERFFSSHPMTEERIRSVEAEIARLPDRRLTSDTRDYQRFRSRYR
jgi:predicted Zn-dependent protease